MILLYIQILNFFKKIINRKGLFTMKVKINFLVFITALIAILAIFSFPVKADSNEKIIVKTDDEYLIYFKDICKKQFMFATSTEDSVTDEEYKSSALDKNTGNEALNVAYIDATADASKPINIWVKDTDGNILIEKEPVDLKEAIDEDTINLINTTTIANAKTSRIEVDTTQTKELKNEVINGVDTKVEVGKVVVKEKNNAKYFYALYNASGDNANEKAKELYELSEKMKSEKTDDTYEYLKNLKQFNTLYNELIPTQWTPVENGEIVQPETAREGDKFVIYIREVDENGKEVVDAKLLECVYKYTPKYEKEPDKEIKEVVKLPVTYDSGTILLIIAGVIIVALIIVMILKKKSTLLLIYIHDDLMLNLFSFYPPQIYYYL